MQNKAETPYELLKTELGYFESKISRAKRKIWRGRGEGFKQW